MAVSRIRGAFTAPRKGETFELRAGLVYARFNYPENLYQRLLTGLKVLNMHTKGSLTLLMQLDYRILIIL